MMIQTVNFEHHRMLASIKSRFATSDHGDGGDGGRHLGSVFAVLRMRTDVFPDLIMPVIYGA
jgi:hypothetical protein